MFPSLTPFLTSLGPAAVLVVMAIIFAETGLLVGFFLPGDSLLFTAGLLTASGALSLPIGVLIIGAALAAIAGDQVGYYLGRRYGVRLFERPDSRLFKQGLRDARAGVLRSTWRPRRRAGPIRAHRAHLHPRRGRHRPDALPPLRDLQRDRGHPLVHWSPPRRLLPGGVPFVTGHVEPITLGIVVVSLVPAALALLRHRVADADPVSPNPADRAV